MNTRSFAFRGTVVLLSLASGLLLWPLGCSTSTEESGVEESQPATGAACQTASDCQGLLPRICYHCSDGTKGCAHFVCNQGKCETDSCLPAVSFNPDAGVSLPEPPGPPGPALPATSPYDIYVDTQFLYTGATPVQTGVAATTISAARVAVLRGIVAARDGTPLASAVVSVLGHPEFGQTTSRANGGFDLVVNGGGPLTVQIALGNYLPVQRTVGTPLRDFVDVPPVVLIGRDTTSAVVNLTAGTMQVAPLGAVTDQAGTRRPIVMIPAGTQASQVMADGTTTPLTTLTIRSTEFTVGNIGADTMPGTLPPTSAYTYATELTADEASSAVRVTFSKPVAFYVDNFVGFAVGGVVPVGYYDRTLGRWVASDNGLVLKILSIANGAAALDVDGSGAAATTATLATLGIAPEELTNLATLHKAGDSLWRVPLTHFTPWDCNWQSAPPLCASYPDGYTFDPGCGAGPGPVDPPTGSGPQDNCEHGGGAAGATESGSIIGCRSQTLGESVDVAGTPFSLRYDSSRAKSFLDRFSTTIHLTTATLPPGLLRVTYELDVAGRTFQGEPALPTPNMSSPRIVWDGLDAYGRQVNSPIAGTVKIGYVYPGVYLTPQRAKNLGPAFGSMGNTGAGNRSRDEITLYSSKTVYLGVDSFQGQLGDSWSLSPVHVYDPAFGVVRHGDGTVHNAVAPFGTALQPSASATTAQSPGGVSSFTAGPDGTLYMARGGGAITMLPPGGTEQPFTATTFPSPVHHLTLGPDGSVYFTSGPATGTSGGHTQINRLAPSGALTTIASQSQVPFSASAVFDTPAVGRDGKVYVTVEQCAPTPWASIAASGTRSFVQIDPANGTVWTMNTSPCEQSASADPDNVPVDKAWIGAIASIAVGADESLYWVEFANGHGHVRRMRSDGKVRSILSWNPPISNPVNYPTSIAVGSAGVYVCDFDGENVWYVPNDGSAPVARIGATGPRDVAPTPGMAARAVHVNCGVGGDLGLGVDANDTLYVAPLVKATAPGSQGIWRSARPVGPGTFNTNFAIPNEDGSEIYNFDSTGRHLQTTNGSTGALLYRFAYDANGLVTSIVDGDNNTTTINRPSAGTITIVSPFGPTTTLTLDPATHWLQSIKDPDGYLVQMAPKSGTDLLGTFTDADGNAHLLQYDATGLLLSDQRPSGATKTLTPTSLPNGKKVAVTTKMGRVHTYQIETLADGSTKWTMTGGDGLPTVTTRSADLMSIVSTPPDGTTYTTTLAPDPRFGLGAPYVSSQTIKTPLGKVMTVTATKSAVLSGSPPAATSVTATTTMNGKTWTTVQDLVANTVTVTSAAGRKTVLGYDAHGRPLSFAVPKIDPFIWAYDPQGRLRTMAQGAGANARTKTFAYDALGYVHTETDPTGHVTTYNPTTLDSAGRVLQEQAPDGTITGFQYDGDGNMTSVTPPSRAAHGFKFAPGDVLAAYDPPPVTGSGTTNTTVASNADEQRHEVLRPDGATVTYNYDPLGKITGQLGSVVTSDGLSSTFGWSPTTGLLSTLATTSPTGNVSLALGYDGFLLTDQTWSGAINGTYHQQLDNNFLVVSDTVAASTVSYFYADADNLLTSAGSETLKPDPSNGLLAGTSLGVVSDTITRDEFGAVGAYLASVGATPIYSVNYGVRDHLGRITTKTETIQGVTTTYAYDYDARGQLWHTWVNGSATATYLYDANGNRTSHNGGTTTDATFDGQDRMLTNLGATYVYGANGELQTKTVNGQVTTYHYDALGNLREVDLPGKTVKYVVDGKGRRVGKSVNGVLTKGWLYRDDLAPIGELDGSGNLVSRFVYGSSRHAPDEIIRGTTTYRVLHDHLGSPRLIVDSTSGAVAERIDYDAWGNVVQDSTAATLPFGFATPFGFAGGMYDADTELTRFGARDYDAATGRWTTKDPIRFDGRQSNLYVYSENDPVNSTDLRGTSCTSEAWKAALACATWIGVIAKTGAKACEQPVTLITSWKELAALGLASATCDAAVLTWGSCSNDQAAGAEMDSQCKKDGARGAYKSGSGVWMCDY